MAYPYTPAFVAFCRGAPVEEISAVFNIPLKSLQAKMRQEGWQTLANRMAGSITVDRTPNDEALAKCEENRAKNYEIASKLRDELGKTIENLAAGTLKIKKLWHNKGDVVEYWAEPTMADLLNIATFARTVHDMTYRALGDTVANGGHETDTSPGASPPTPPITIVLPEAIARPRLERCINVESRILSQDAEE
jgi:hypothetical protein